MKFISKDGSIHKNRLSMLVCDVRRAVSNRLHQRSDEDYIMDFEEFDDDDFDRAFDDEDEPSPNIDTLVVHKIGDNQFTVVNESHDQSPTPVASYTVSLDDTGNETLPKGDYSVPFTPGTSKDDPNQSAAGAWGFIPANRSDGVDEDEMHLIRGYLNEDIPEYVGKLKMVAPKPDPMEVVNETSDKPEQL